MNENSSLQMSSQQMSSRFLYLALAFVFFLAEMSFGQSREGLQSERTNLAIDDQGEDQSQLTYRELKTFGAKRSKYREFKPQVFGTEMPKPKLAEFRAEIKPILDKACVQCHGADVEEGNIRIDQLDPNLVLGDDVDWWLEVVAVLTNGEMPPADEVKLADSERAKVIDWISSEIQVASAIRRDQESHSSFRRMTRYEFRYAMQDLLGSPVDFGKDLPPEAVSEEGFKNSSEMLQMSVVQFGGYRDAIQSALRNAMVEGERPLPLYWGISMTDASALSRAKFEDQVKKIKGKYKDDPDKLSLELEKHAKRSRTKHPQTYFKDVESGVTTRAAWSYGGARYALKPTETRSSVPVAANHVAILPARQKLILELGNQIPDFGSLRVRVRASRSDSDDNDNSIERIPSLQLEFGWQASNDSQASVRISQQDLAIDASVGKPEIYEWVIPLSEIYPRNSVRKTSRMGETPSPSEYIKLINSSVSKRDIQIDYVEVTAPFYEQWPPESHIRILGKHESKINETQAAQKILERFMFRAWRRDVSPDEVAQKVRLFAEIRPKCDDFKEAIAEVLANVLSSPKFLYLVQARSDSESEKLDQFELATRLSMFLWCSIPDQRLLDLASENRLDSRNVLAGEVTRMLADQRAQRFSRQFTRQWLGMQLLDFLNVDKKVYRQFDSDLKEAMQKEPIEFFHELLQKNESVLEFLHADFAMVNERLSKHYGMPDVYGNHFRRVEVAPDQRRGGVLTQAGLLAMNSDGKDSHPLKRGIWLLEKLLNDPPPPPPPAVPEIDLADPAIAKLSLKEQIENHRNHAACMSCHAKIDPWGIAFENFDAVGAWRNTVNGKRVDASSKLFNQQKLDGMDGLKRFLLANRQDQFVRAMVHKLTTYGLGRPLAFGDRSKIDEMTAKLRNEGDGLATMVTIIVTSDLFRSR